jgi:diaminohydroxyphosphoribosylaminopyrimidine deaminase/5-amino-6-(5-phosphoribosylamino)uracil reductase
MQRCLQLAAMGSGRVAPNPMVGAVLVCEERVIGEGYHQRFGEAHAEVNCINSVADADKGLISKSTLYVSLEPCVHFGKTAPCTDLIVKSKIPDVVIGCRDSFDKVDGKGVEKLKTAGIHVAVGMLESDCRELNKRFFTFHEKQRPYIVLKWAESGDGKMAGTASDRVFISNEFTNRLVHKWRSEEAAVLVGTNTALLDDPALTTRLWPGYNPLRLVIDSGLKLPAHLKLFDGSVKTVVFNYLKQEDFENLLYYKLDKTKNIPVQIIEALYRMQVQSVMIEGGSKLLQSFIYEGLWDEARIIKNSGMIIKEGLDAPVLNGGILVEEQRIKDDTVSFIKKNAPDD